MRFETSLNQSLIKKIPDGKATGYIIAPIALDAAKTVLNDRKVFDFGSRNIGLLLTIYINAVESLRQKVEAVNHPNVGDADLKRAKGFCLDILYFLQEKLDKELEDSPLRRYEVQEVFDRVDEISRKWYGTKHNSPP